MIHYASVMIRAVALTLLLAHCAPSYADEKRVALVIGNSNYHHTASLSNPTNDARLLSAVLNKSGFEVLHHTNLDLKAMKRAIAELGSRARGYGRDTVVLFYFAGHGVQVAQSNYLIPVDAKIESEGDVAIEGINAASILESLSDARAKVNIVVLDACRNNPYRTSFRSAARGLVRLDGPPGFLIAFSTDPGRVAADGPPGGNSPYAESLARSIGAPGLGVEDAFKKVRKDVYAATNGTQIPWETSSLLDDLYFSGGQPATQHDNGRQSKGTDEVGRLQLEAARKQAQDAEERARKSAAAEQLARDRLEAERQATRARDEREAALRQDTLPQRKNDQQSALPAEAAIVAYIEGEYLKDNERFAPMVDYYDRGRLARELVLADKQKYAARWPSRNYRLIPGSLKLLESTPTRIIVIYGFSYRVANASKSMEGSGRVQLTLIPDGGSFIVAAVREIAAGR